MTEERLREIEDRRNGASKGKWHTLDTFVGNVWVCVNETPILEPLCNVLGKIFKVRDDRYERHWPQNDVNWMQKQNDAVFLAAAYEDIGELLSRTLENYFPKSAPCRK
jgi:hypothetical protein